MVILRERMVIKMILGITGSSGAGKSTICEILAKKYGAKVINADKIAKKLSKKGTSYMAAIIEKFGKDIIDENGELKRKKLAEIIYTDPKKRQELNSCTFPFIKEEIIKQIDKTKNKIIIIDAPLLYEAGLDKICDKVIGVIAKKELQLDRMVARDNIDYEQAEKRLAAQKSNSYYQKKCDIIIENNDNNTQRIEEEIKKYTGDVLWKKNKDKFYM